MARTRNRTSGYARGTNRRYVNGSLSYTLTRGPFAITDEHCIDVNTSPDTDHDLTLYKRKLRGGRMNGSEWYASGTYSIVHDYQAWPIFSTYPMQLSSCPSIPSPNWIALVNQALVGLNPNVPVFDVANFVIELRELPSAIRQLGMMLNGLGSAADYAAGPILQWKFGWQPLINDLQTLLNWSEEVDKRLKSLYRAGKQRRIKRKLSTIQASSFVYEKAITVTYSHYVRVLRREATNQRAWFTCRLTPTATFPSLEKKFIDKFKSIYSLSQVPSTVWNSLPWTWLIDYFTDIGSFISANQGVLPYEPTWLNVMYSGDDSITEDYKLTLKGPKYGSSMSMSPLSMRTISKQRRVYYRPRPMIYLDPIITKGQRAIIASLLTARFLGSRGAYQGTM